MALSVTVSEMAPRMLTEVEKPRGKRQLDSRRTRAAMSGKVAAIAGASQWRTEERQRAKKRCCVPRREGRHFLTGRAAALITCSATGGLEVSLVQLPELEPEAA